MYAPVMAYNSPGHTFEYYCCILQTDTS